MPRKRKPLTASRRITSFRRDEDGVVLILTTLLIPVLFGILALTVEMAAAQLNRVEYQRVADLSSFAGASLYAKTGDFTKAQKQALQVARLNNTDPGLVTVDLVDSPRDPDNKAIRVTVRNTRKLVIAPVIGLGDELRIGADATTELRTRQSTCLLALDPAGAGIYLSGGVDVHAKDCRVGSAASGQMPNGTKLETDGFVYGTSPPYPDYGLMKEDGSASDVQHGDVLDPFADSPQIGAVTAALSEARALSNPPQVSGSNVTFDWSANPPVGKCTAASEGGGQWLVTCPSRAAPYDFGSMTVGGGARLRFNPDGPATNTYRIQSVNVGGGGAATFGPGNYQIAAGINAQGGSSASFGAGNFWIGPGSGGNAIYTAGSSQLSIDSGTGQNVFDVGGNIRTDGGGCVMLPSGEHHVRGSMSLSGAVILGAGLWAVTDYLAFGENGGGTAACGGSVTGLRGLDVTIALGGDRLSSNWACQGRAFCMLAGYDGTRITAPTAGSTAGLAIVGPQSADSTGGMLMSGGAHNTGVAGGVYFPFGPVKLSGDGDLIGMNLVGMDCLKLVGKEIQVIEGATVSTTCTDDPLREVRVALVD